MSEDKDKKNGHEKFEEMGQKLKAEQEAKAVEAEKGKELAMSELAKIRQNPELAKMYQDNAQVGAENLAGELPLLKVHSAGRSTKNTLKDGTEPSDGAFFYKPTAEEFDSVTCHILTISKGFRAKGLEEGKEDIFNQIVGGVIIDGEDLKPFVMYMTGLKLSYLWEFGKQANKYTHARPIPIPMFAMAVEMKTEKIANNFGKSWIIKFEILKSEEGTPVLVMDAGKFQFLKDSVEAIEDTIASIIAAKTTEKQAVEQPVHIQGEEVPETDVDPDDIPF